MPIASIAQLETNVFKFGGTVVVVAVVPQLK